jgi:hypothetical protein
MSDGVGTYILEDEKDSNSRITIGEVDASLMKGVVHADVFKNGPDCLIKLEYRDGRGASLHIKSEGTLPDWSQKGNRRR